MVIAEITSLLKSLFDFLKKNENKTINYTEVRGNYLDLRGSKVTLNVSLKEYFDNFSELEDKNQKIIITKKQQKIDPKDFIEIIAKHDSFIKEIQKTDLRQPYLTHILYSIHLESKISNYQDFIKEKNSNPMQVRIFNLYYSGWIKLILAQYNLSLEKYSFHEEFEKLVNDKTKVFVHSGMSIAFIKRILVNNFIQKKMNVMNLHGIGKNNNKTIKKSLEELKKEGYNLDFKIEKQSNEGERYIVLYF